MLHYVMSTGAASGGITAGTHVLSSSPPSYTDWIGAIGAAVSGLFTALAVIIAAILLFPQLRSFRQEGQRHRRRQAELVMGWVQRVDRTLMVSVQNGSKRGIYQCMTFLNRDDFETDVPPFNRYEGRISFRVVLLPDERWSYRIRRVKTTAWTPGQPVPLVELVFRDADHQWWWIKPMGQPVEITRPPDKFLTPPKIAPKLPGRRLFGSGKP
jgi:hypothetical protein